MFVTVGPMPASVGNGYNPARFFYVQEHNEAKSRELDMPIYEDVLYIEIYLDPLNKNVRKATEHDQHIYRHEWIAFRDQTKKANAGVSIDVLFPPTSSYAVNLRRDGLYTVEELAEANRGEFSARAKRYLESLKDASQFREYEARLEAKDKVIFEKDELIKALQDKLTAYENDQGLAVRLKDLEIADHQRTIWGLQNRIKAYEYDRIKGDAA